MNMHIIIPNQTVNDINQNTSSGWSTQSYENIDNKINQDKILAYF